MANPTAEKLSRDEYFYGHKACAGCGGALAVRAALKVLGQNAVSVLPAGCMSKRTILLVIGFSDFNCSCHGFLSVDIKLLLVYLSTLQS